MSKVISIEENHLNLVFYVTDQQELRLLHCSALAFQDDRLVDLNTKRFRLVELQATGENHEDHHGSKSTGTSPANRLRYDSHQDYRNVLGRKLEFTQVDHGCLPEKLRPAYHIKTYGTCQFFADLVF
jgi:alpha-galactosidase